MNQPVRQHESQQSSYHRLFRGVVVTTIAAAFLGTIIFVVASSSVVQPFPISVVMVSLQRFLRFQEAKTLHSFLPIGMLRLLLRIVWMPLRGRNKSFCTTPTLCTKLALASPWMISLIQLTPLHTLE